MMGGIPGVDLLRDLVADVHHEPDGSFASAVFDASREYRFALTRRRHEGTGCCMFIMLNPSTADAFQLDPTVTRCRNYAWGWGCHKLVVGNIFALRSTDPQALYRCPDPVHPRNMEILRKLAANADMVVCAWGVHGALLGQGNTVRAMLAELPETPVYYLGLNKDGSPKHPLYLSKDLVPTRWTL